MRSTLSLFALVLVGILAGAPASAWASDPQQPPAQPPPAQQTQAPAERKFTASVGMFINVIKADKVGAFEIFVKRLAEAMAKTDKENRRKQAAGWRVFKSTQPDAQGNVVYLFFIDPTVDADYTITRIMVDVLPREEVTAIFETIKDAWVTQSMLNLDLLANFGAPPAGMIELQINK
jgi:hypothetical protein